MLNNKIITVGQLAEQANVSVRTLQYYDKIGLLKPSVASEGGRRLYYANDITMVHQIITLKSLGLSLKEIGQRITPINSTEDIVDMLNRQFGMIEEQVAKSNRLLESIQMLKKEIGESKQVDWEKYSNMVKLIQDNNEYYWVVNYLEKDILSNIAKIYEENTDELPIEWLKTHLAMMNELELSGKPPDSVEAQELAATCWQLVQKYTNGDSLLQGQLYKFFNSSGQWPAEFGKIEASSKVYFEKVIQIYIDNNNLDVSNEISSEQ